MKWNVVFSKLKVIVVFCFIVAASAAPTVARVRGSHQIRDLDIFFNDRHVYARPNRLKQGRLLAALVRHGELLLPLRSIVEHLGGTITYDAYAHDVLVTKPGTRLRLSVGNPEVEINGDVRPLDVPPRVVHGIVFVPVRVIAESLGAFVTYVSARKTVVIRYVPSADVPPLTVPTPRAFPRPAPPAVRATVGPGAPIPTPVPGPETIVEGNVAIVPQISNAFTARRTGSSASSYDVRIASELADTGLMLDASYRNYAYGVPFNQVTAIGSKGSTLVPAFSARDAALDAHLGLKLTNAKWYVSGGYTLLSNNYGYPRLGGFGVGIQKLPILTKSVSYELAAFYYPNVGGTCSTAACSGGPYNLTYKLVTYRAALIGKLGPVLLTGGFEGDRGFAKYFVPGYGFAHAGPYAGVGFHF